jgi:hypothetical protein
VLLVLIAMMGLPTSNDARTIVRTSKAYPRG